MSNYSQQLPRDELLRALAYEPSTGIFRWKIRQRRIGGFYEPGDVAGFKEACGYWCIGLSRRQYKAHRLAWLYCHGVWPVDDIDHINGKRDDNRICNLRIGGKSVNPRNQKKRINNTTGFKGVTRSRSRFMAKISVNYDRKYLGTFDTKEEAYEAYCVAAKKYYGDFARLP